jgi:Arm domain-containing DNA-binding protein
MPTRRISKSTVDSLFCPPGKDRDIVWDDKLKGFGVTVYPTGLKTYVAQYRKDGRSHRVVLGKHGRLTPDEARKEAKALFGDVEKGANPLLGHSQPSTTQRYAHLDADPMRRAVETIGSTIAAAMAGKQQ